MSGRLPIARIAANAPDALRSRADAATAAEKTWAVASRSSRRLSAYWTDCCQAKTNADTTIPVPTAADASTALDLLLTGKFDIALVDIEMPGLDGFQLVARVRAHEKLRHIPLVMLTVHEGIASIDRAYHLGATSFTTKPVNWRQLSYHLRYVLRASRMQAEAREAQARAEESIALRANSLSTIRNEFNNSLNSIIEFANRIANGGALDPSNPHVRHAQTIAAASKHLLRIMQHAEASSASGALHERPLQLPGAFAQTQDPLPQEAGST